MSFPVPKIIHFMRKAKIILFAIGVIALVGGALAFKAHKDNDVTYFICNDSNTHCNKPVTPSLSKDLTTIDPGIPRTKVTNAITAADQNNSCTVGCPNTKIIYYRSNTTD